MRMIIFLLYKKQKNYEQRNVSCPNLLETFHNHCRNNVWCVPNIRSTQIVESIICNIQLYKDHPSIKAIKRDFNKRQKWTILFPYSWKGTNKQKYQDLWTQKSLQVHTVHLQKLLIVT